MRSEDLASEALRENKVHKETKRQFSVQGEIDRKIHYSNMQIKDYSFYNKKDSLWNEPQRLHPKKFAPYSV